MTRPEVIPCPTCDRPIDVFPQCGGRGTGDLTSYYVQCVCGVKQEHLSGDGTKAGAIRDWNRWAKEKLGLPVKRSRKNNNSAPDIQDMRVAIDIRFAEESVKSCNSLLSNLRCLYTTNSVDFANEVGEHISSIEKIESKLAKTLAELRATTRT